MTEEEGRARLRYLQLKAKAAGSAMPSESTPTPAPEPAPNPALLGIDPNADLGNRVAQGASLPFRIGRGVAVGAQNLATNLMTRGALATIPGASAGAPPLSGVANRAAEAFQPGFKPEGAGESVAAAIGESGPLMPLGGAMSAGWKGVRLAAGVGAGTSALMQQSERGSIDPTEVSITAALNALLPGLPMLAKKAYAPMATWLTKLPEEAFEKVMADPNFLRRYAGTVESIRGRAQKLIEGFNSVEQGLKTQMNNMEEVLQIRPNEKEVAEEFLKTKGVARSMDVIVKELKDIQRRSAKFVSEKVKSPILSADGKEVYKIVKSPGLTQRERLQKVLALDRDFNRNVNSDPDLLKLAHTQELKKMIGKEFKAIDGGEAYQALRTKWSEFKDIADGLSKDLIDDARSPAMFEKLMRGDIKGVLSGPAETKKAAIKALEAYGGIRSLMEPLRDDIYAGMLRNKVSVGGGANSAIARGLFAFAPKLALGNMLLSSPAFLNKVPAAIRGGLKYGGRAATVAPSLLRGDQ